MFRVLESNNVIQPQGQAQGISAQPATKPTGDARVKELMEAFAGVAIERARVFKTPFPELRRLQMRMESNWIFSWMELPTR